MGTSGRAGSKQRSRVSIGRGHRDQIIREEVQGQDTQRLERSQELQAVAGQVHAHRDGRRRRR